MEGDTGSRPAIGYFVDQLASQIDQACSCCYSASQPETAQHPRNFIATQLELLAQHTTSRKPDYSPQQLIHDLKASCEDCFNQQRTPQALDRLTQDLRLWLTAKHQTL